MVLRPIVLVLALAIFPFSCGGRYIRLNLDRAASFERPVYVAIYFLSKGSALDEESNADLVDRADELGKREGVVGSEVRPVYPGTPDVVLNQEYDPKISWVLVAANFKDASPCARAKVAVKKDAKLALRARVDEKCIEVKKAD